MPSQTVAQAMKVELSLKRAISIFSDMHFNDSCVCSLYCLGVDSFLVVRPHELYLTTSEQWFGQEQEGILPLLLSSSGIV